MKKLKIKIFADTADQKTILSLNKLPEINGFTTNPSFMRQAGVKNYLKFARKILKFIKKPISFEVIADDFKEMERQAKLLSSLGKNVYVKIPITNTKDKSSFDLIKKLSHKKIKLNITALTMFSQVRHIAKALYPKTPAIISIFAGRIADTGKNPMPIMKSSAHFLENFKNIELLWASCREVFNIFEAEKAGCQIITVKPEIIPVLKNLGKPLKKLSLETVRKFYEDARASQFKL